MFGMRQTLAATALGATSRPRTVLSAQLLLIAGLAVTVGLSGVGLSPAGWAVGLTCGVITNAALAFGRSHYCADRLTVADWVTLARATVAFGVEAYEDVWTKAGALLQSIALNHALLDGNKRLAWVAARVFLDLNDVPPVEVDVDQAEAFVIQVVTHELDTVEEVAKGLAGLYSDGPRS